MKHSDATDTNSVNRLFGRWLLGLALTTLLISAGTARAATYFYHNDHLGTPQVLTDKNKEVVWKAEYDPFGKATETVAVVEQNLRFPGQYLERESGGSGRGQDDGSARGVGPPPKLA